MDRHFRDTPFERNTPVLLALMGLWYNNFFGAQTHAILPYDSICTGFPHTCSREIWKATGNIRIETALKCTIRQACGLGRTRDKRSACILSAYPSRDNTYPCDFIAPALSHNPVGDHHPILLSNFFAQTEALMKGKTLEEAVREMKASGMNEEEIRALAPFKVFKGNRPTTSILLKKITPRTLGSLIAMYEHKIFVQGVIWNIFSFDQWGVELGKQLANKILHELMEDGIVASHDPSTNGLINAFKNMRKEVAG